MLVGSGAEPTKDFSFSFKAFGERATFSTLDSLQDAGDGERSHRSDGLSERVSARQEFGGGRDIVNKAETEGLGGINDLGREHETQRGAAADEARKALGSSIARDETELHLG